MTAGTVTVTLIYTPPRYSWRRDKRWQPWRWVAKSANGNMLANSGEMYTNRADCITAAMTCFGDLNTAVMTDENGDSWTLRTAVDA